MRLDDLKRGLDALHAESRERFAQVEARFVEVDARFAQVDARFDQVDARFAQVDARFEQVDARFAQVDARFEQVDARITAEAAETRRHFDVVAEALKSDFQTFLSVVLDRLDRLERIVVEMRSERGVIMGALHDHEVRIATLEHRRD